MVEEGTLEPLSLLKNRIMTPNSLNTPSTSSPNGPPFDSTMRPATTPGPVETDAKASFGSTVESQGYGSIPTKEIHDYFITSVLASLSQRFCSKTGAIPLDSRSFLLPAEEALADPAASQVSSASTKRARGPLVLTTTLDANNVSFQDEFDAMKHAEAWFMGNGEREELLSRRNKERETLGSAKDAGDTDSRLLQSGFASRAPRRASNAATAGGAMYPTPPDGVQVTTGATPFIDGTTSSPGNQVPSAGMGDLETSLAAPGNLGDGFGEGWDATQSKREQSFNQENWDLNNDVFVENDITDADFNFFDEQPNAMVANAPDVDLGNGHSNTGSSDQPATREPQLPPDQEEVKMESPPAPPVFAKPELKHARSTLGETRMRDKGKPRPVHGVKRPLSPFDPTTVYKKLKASIGPALANNNTAVIGSGRRGSAFDRLDFDRSFTVVNKKYEHNGRFNFNEDRPEENAARRSTSPPTTNYLRQHGKGRPALKDLPSKLGAQVAGIAGAMDHDNIQRNAVRADESTSDADDISLVSDQDDMSDFSDEPSSPARNSNRRRKFADEVESIAPSTRDFEILDEQLVSGAELAKLSINDSLEVPLSSYFADPEPISPRAILSDDEFIMVAQILTEQAVSGNVSYSLPELTHASSEIASPRQQIMHNLRSSLQTLQAILPPSLQAANTCPLRQLVDVQDVPLLATPSRIQPRLPGNTQEQRPSLVQIAPPHLELRRYDTKLSVLPSAVSFWESLGLGPSQGHKDILSVSVFPNLEGMADSADVFLDRLRSTYESMKLGSFERMTTSPMTVPNGLLPYDVDKTSNTPILAQVHRSNQPLVDEMAKLAVAIFNSVTPPKNFVIFFVYTPDNPGTIIESCLAFQRMFELYRRAITERKKPSQNEVVLQLVPIDFVATSTSMVVLPPSECIRLCLEVYDRCTLFGGPMPSPAIVLEQQLTQGINFQLRNQPSANILQENSIMHIAYAQSVDERWITAAWTDNRGCKQMTASYCLGRKEKPLTRTFADIAHEIWTTTNDLTSIWKVHWRIVITKVGSMDQQEINDWMTLAQTEVKSSVTLVLLTVDTDPSLQLMPAVSKVPVAAFYSTPVSTPQPSTMSPEQSGNPSTPKPAGGASTPGADNTIAEAESDASLVDITDTTWGAIVSHRLNTSHSLTDPSPALISGYLIKRGASRADDPPAVMEVNVVHCEGNPRMHEMLLREMLSVFRGLGTIARARSVTQREGDVRPWHVAAVEKGVRALYQLL
ncbi:hypothetical protein N0V93_002917 [Gnomoniopsis smithogilvyi]|uniref:Mediator of RNA polymerase II transcription subunit 13 n=1 Tax=Gnomoniopsis smithogilvyi TaxID=1191159 RepID=A0A9W9CZE0_9PEZI|nr:hypothetical protein N0V93_002917 [Gnomoniopsis smithogilvyi]